MTMNMSCSVARRWNTKQQDKIELMWVLWLSERLGKKLKRKGTCHESTKM